MLSDKLKKSIAEKYKRESSDTHISKKLLDYEYDKVNRLIDAELMDFKLDKSHYSILQSPSMKNTKLDIELVNIYNKFIGSMDFEHQKNAYAGVSQHIKHNNDLKKTDLYNKLSKFIMAGGSVMHTNEGIVLIK